MLITLEAVGAPCVSTPREDCTEMDSVLSGMQLISTEENLSPGGQGSSLHLVACVLLFPWPVCTFQAEKGEEWKPMASVKWSC